MLRLLEPLVTDTPTTLSLHELAHRLGVADATARKTLLRLKSFRHVTILDDGTVGVRTEVPALSPSQLRRLPRTVEAMHHRYLARAA